MRKFWLENHNGQMWNLASEKLVGNACFMANPDGLGIKTKVKSFEIENTYFIEEVSTNSQSISGTLHFADYKHFNEFVKFVGNINTDKPLKLYYSMQGISMENKLDKQWYKFVLITELKKSEISLKTATLQIKANFECLSRWKQDIDIDWEVKHSGNALTYPYQYPYTYGGNSLVLEIDNTGNLGAGCVVKIEGHTDTPTFRLMQEDNKGDLQIIEQARYNLIIKDGQRLEVDINPDTQKAVLYSENGVQEDVYYLGEKDYAYSNFITIPTGKSLFIVSANNQDFGKCTLHWSRQREVL